MMHLAGLFRRLAEEHGPRTAIVDDRGAWSFADFVARISRFGNALHGLGLERGDRVALLLPDLREYLEADYGTMSAGFTRVPLDPRLPRREVAEQLRHAGVRALVCHADFGDRVSGLRGEVETLEVLVAVGGAVEGGLDYEALLAAAPAEPPGEDDGEMLASLNFSGGTTGRPKATMLRHRNLATAARTTARGFDIRPDGVFLNVRPLWPIAQIITMAHLLAGATVVLGGRFDPARFPELVAESRATRSSLVPTQLVRLIERLEAADPRLSRLEAIYIGGSRVPPAVFERALALLGPKIGVLYGLTEAPVTCYLPPAALDAPADRRAALIGSVGRVLPGYEVRLDGGETALPGQQRTGEILIRGDNVMAGYWQRPDATAAALRDGWLHTGDIGSFDAEGNLAIVGRLKDVIRTGSSSVVPKEVEDVLAEHPAVADVAVLGAPDPEWGEAVTAFVVLRPGATASAPELIAHCRARLAGYKTPKRIEFRTGLPRSHYGKVLQAELLATLAQ